MVRSWIRSFWVKSYAASRVAICGRNGLAAHKFGTKFARMVGMANNDNAAKMDRKLARVSRLWTELAIAKTAARKLRDKMGDEAWREYCASRGHDSDIDRLFCDLGA